MSGNSEDSASVVWAILRRMVSSVDLVGVVGLALVCVGASELLSWPYALVIAGVAIIVDRML